MKTDFLFDLDGTLTDPKVGITKSVQFALHAFDIRVEDPDELVDFIGPPLREHLMERFGFDREQAERALVEYRKRFADTGIFENTLYPGMDRLLAGLRRQGKRLVVATSKPTIFARRVLEHFHIAEYFAFVAGAELDGVRGEKREVVAHALEQCGIDPAQAVMVGDRRYDMEGAAAFGIKTVGVSYGYGGREELAAAGADYIVDTVAELDGLLASL